MKEKPYKQNYHYFLIGVHILITATLTPLSSA